MDGIEEQGAAVRQADGGVKPEMAAEEEVRFAIVMYGGVSLAIYINGVTQELFNLVCATAPDRRGGTVARLGAQELGGSQRVYRRLGQYLQQWQDMHVRRGQLQDGEKTRYTDMTEQLLGRKVPATPAPIRTRFIVDVLSGTSAGGINAIYLAKALANAQGLDGIRKLWISEGDMAKLINDHRSDEGLPPKSRELNGKGPASLLNSRRMYCKLLEALAGMREEGVGSAPATDAANPASPLVDELDLFITATDLEGLPLPITLTDKVTYEKRHRSVFHFRYDKGGLENDFRRDNDPFLAFAARCTSSFPFAFEPMMLDDIRQVSHRDYPALDPETAAWKKFYAEYWRHSLFELEEARLQDGEAHRIHADADQDGERRRKQERLQKRFLTRAFGDGGYLDNKPFSYATATLMRRAADVPVKRKLLYVEPVPEHPEQSDMRSGKPDFAENIRAAVLELPGKEMIREDIERVLERNRLLRRVSSYTRDVDSDIFRMKDFPLIDEKRAQPVSEMLNRYGIAYGAYHRLRVDDTTQRLGEILARVAGFDPDSSASAAVRELVVAWRKDRYTEEVVDGQPDKKLETNFLYRFDLQFPLRRLAFINRRINQLARLDHTARKLLDTWRTCGCDKAVPGSAPWNTNERGWAEEFRAELGRLKKRINDDRRKWRDLEEGLCTLAVADLGSLLQIEWRELRDILELTPGARAERLAALVHDNPTFDALANIVTARRREMGPMYEPSVARQPSLDAATVAQACIDFYFARYPFYDMVSFPVQYGTGSTEANEIDVYRISPEDATLLCKERSGRHKLAGTTLMNFGAFIEESWRRNDMLWGRLDAAERLICAVMPIARGDALGCEVRDSLIKEAQAAILQEDLTARDREVLSKALLDCVKGELPADLDAKSFREWLTHRLGNEGLSTAMRSVLGSCMDGEGLWHHYKKSFQVNRRYDAEQAVRSMARASAVTAHMLQELARAYRLNSKTFGWLAMFASMFWGIVEAAVPRSLANLLFRHWVQIAYLIAFAIIGIGMLTTVSGMTTAGWIALATTIGVHALFTVTGYYIDGYERHPLWSWLRHVVKFALAAAMIALLVGGVLFYHEGARQWLTAKAITGRHIYLGSLAAALAVWLGGALCAKLAAWRKARSAQPARQSAVLPAEVP